MSLLQLPFDAHPLRSTRRRWIDLVAMVGGLGFRRRSPRIAEGEMPDWQARDIGFRDGPPTARRRGSIG